MSAIPPELFLKVCLEGPEKHGYRQCPHCGGYGSSLKEAADRCTMCGGSGLIKNEETELTQFKEHEVERPAWLGVADWEDNSWHNDAMPHATLYLREVRDGETYPMPVIEFWVNYAAPDHREVGTLYEVVFQRDWSGESGGDTALWAGDDEAEAVLWERAARTAKSMIAEIIPRPDLMACSTFSELHDHCDANMLGDVEAMTAEGEAHRTEADDPEVGITGWAHAVHDRAIQIVTAWIEGREPRYYVFNETDGILADCKPMTREECDGFMVRFRVRFTEQGYYHTAAGYDIPVSEVRLKRIPEGQL